MNGLLILGVVGAGIWAMRASAIVLARGRALPEPAIRALGYAKHAVLAAIIAGILAGGQGFGGLAAPSPQLGAALVAGVVAWRTRSLLPTVASGMATAAVLVTL